jgi:hypothetical protein
LYIRFDCKPIELTEDILIKCGFEIPAEDGFFQRVCNGVVKIKIDKTIKLPVVLIGGTILTHILYLHQLQNLYFDLTGTELELKAVENLAKA